MIDLESAECIDVDVEAALGLLALAQFKAFSHESYMPQLHEALSSKAVGLNRDGTISKLLLRMIGDSEGIVSRWRWDWWELDQKERGEAHFMSIGIWVQRAAVLILCQAPWSLSHLEDSDLPELGVITALQRSLEGQEWRALLNVSLLAALKEVDGILSNLLERRAKIVNDRVRNAPIDRAECERFVGSAIEEMRTTYVPFSKWLRDAGWSLAVDRGNDDAVAGVSQLLSREWFVSDDYKDYSTSIIAPSTGQALVEFEARAMASAVLRSFSSSTPVSALNEEQFWRTLGETLKQESTRCLVVGVGVLQFECWRELDQIRRAMPDAGDNQRLRFQSVRPLSQDQGRAIIAMFGDEAVRLRRFKCVSAPAECREELPLEDGGVVVSLREISKEEIERWANSDEERAARYRDSLLFRAEWSFEIERINPRQVVLFRTAGR